MLPRATAAPHRPAAARAVRRGVVAIVAVALGAGLGAIATASADEPVEPIVLRYDAEAGCPDAADFGGEVRARTSRARPAEPGERARAFTVRIRRAGRAYRGRLEVREASGATSARDVSGGSCAEVASAIALVTALAIDPEAVTAPRVAGTFASAAGAVGASSLDGGEPPRDARRAHPDASAPPPAASRPPVDAADAAPDATGAPLDSRDAAPDAMAAPLDAAPDATRPPLDAADAAPVATAPPPDAPEPDPYASRRARVLAGLSFAATTGLASRVVGSPGVFVEAGLAPDGVLAPTLRLSLDRVLGATELAPGGWLARFDRTRVLLDAVVLRVPIGPVDLAPAIAFGAGAVVAEGRVGPAVVTRARPWVEASVGARARLWLLGRVSLEVDGGVAFPFVRDTFAIDPATTIDRTPAAAAFVGGAAAVRAY